MITPLQILERIDAYTLATEDQSPRRHLGASEVGDKCLRALFYKFRWCGQEQFPPRMLRLFARGDREEKVFVDLLKGAGFDIMTPQPGDMDRFRFKDCASHFAGTCDGIAMMPDTQGVADEDYCLLEFKTWKVETKDRPSPAFDALVRQGIKETNNKHFVQLQVYMGQLGLQMALYCAICKNDDRLHLEWVKFDRLVFETALSKAETVINATATNPPERISSDPSTFTCRYCIYNKICHDNQPIPTAHTHCRNCIHASPAAAGTWECGAGHTFGTVCGDYLPITGKTP